MEPITMYQILWLMLASSVVGGVMIILSALVTGYLVFRSKREQHETLFPNKPKKRNGPIIVDEFATEAMKDDDKGLPDIIEQMNKRVGAELAAAALRKGGE
jgi:hypothetical protein